MRNKWAKEEELGEKSHHSVWEHVLWLHLLGEASSWDPTATISSIPCSLWSKSVMASYCCQPLGDSPSLIGSQNQCLHFVKLCGVALCFQLGPWLIPESSPSHPLFLQESMWVETSSSLPVFILHFVHVTEPWALWLLENHCVPRWETTFSSDPWCYMWMWFGNVSRNVMWNFMETSLIGSLFYSFLFLCL